ncbi:MAG: NUDIX hydrolase, partial [Dialister sp.]|nr:NUDIX hydrolase [Dialister sp.]
MSIEKEKLIHRAPAFEGRMLHVFDDEVEIHGHKTTREVVLHPGASAIIPVTEDGEILFVRQYRYAVEQPLLEIPAGKLDGGEDPDTCAARELTEETGY